MSIPNVASLYQKLSHGAEGGHEFARFIRILLAAEYRKEPERFLSESDASGDYRKLDGYIPGDKDFPDNIVGFQFKFFSAKLSRNQKEEVRKSLMAAIGANEYMQEFVLVTPEDFMKEQQSWFDALKKEFEQEYWLQSMGISRKCGLTISHWGHTRIVELALKHDHVGAHYFPELFPKGVGKFKLAKWDIDTTMCSWQKWNDDFPGGYQVANSDPSLGLTSDPVFDFQFKNSTPEIFLLNRIEIHIERLWSKLSGIPATKLLRSLGTVIHEMDFDQPINVIKFPDPMIFDANAPTRFHLQLNGVNKGCPDNRIQLKFWFYFDEITIPTDSIILAK